jgi:predicted acetyltransferase
MHIEIVPASMSLLDGYGSYIRECYKSGIDHYENDVNDPVKSLVSVIDAAAGRNLPEGWEPYETYFAVRAGKLLGAIRYRLGDNDFIRTHIGHIGYETRPSERGNGVAKSLLRFIVNSKLRSTALITCDVDNVASVKVIESVPHKPVGSDEKLEHVNPTKIKFYIEPAT